MLALIVSEISWKKSGKKGECLLRNNLQIHEDPFVFLLAQSTYPSMDFQGGAKRLLICSMPNSMSRISDNVMRQLTTYWLVQRIIFLRTPITDLPPPIFVSTGNEVSVRYSGGRIEILDPELGDDYAPLVADGYKPVGRISGGINTEEEIRSFEIDFQALVYHTAIRVIEIWSGEDTQPLSGYDQASLIARLYPDWTPGDESEPNDSRQISIPEIRRLILPDDLATQEFLKEIMGYSVNPELYEKWRGNAIELIDGIEMLNNKLAESRDNISQEEVTILSDLKSRFFDPNGRLI